MKDKNKLLKNFTDEELLAEIVLRSGSTKEKHRLDIFLSSNPTDKEAQEDYELCLKGKIVIEGYPDLKQLNFSNNNLNEITIKNCPDLKLVPVEDLKAKNLRVISYSDNSLSVEEKSRLDALGLPDGIVKSKINGDAQELLDNKYPSPNDKNKVEKLDISELGLKGELNLCGFTNLRSLDCSNNQLTKLIIKDCPNLKYLDASNNEIKRTFLLNSNLETVFLNNNKLTSFDASILSGSIKKLDLTANKIKNLFLNGCKNLETLNCGINEITNLDLRSLDSLKRLYCYDNSLSKLQLKYLSNLEELYQAVRDDKGKLRWAGNAVGGLYEGLDLNGCSSLHTLDCAENNLKELDLSDLEKLNFVSCRANRLFTNSLKKLKLTNCKSLDFLDTTLQHDLVVSDFRDCQNLKELYCSSDSFDYENISGYHSQKEEPQIPNHDEGYNLPTPKNDKPQPELDYKKLYYELLEKIKKGEITLENKEQILNSNLDESKKQELLRLLDKQNKTGSEKQSSNPVNAEQERGWLTLRGLMKEPSIVEMKGKVLKTLLEYINNNDDKTQQELADYVSQLIGQKITRFIISRTLKKHGITRKKRTYHYKEMNYEKAEEFAGKYFSMLDMPILALDECSFHIGEAPRYGYAKRGSRVISQRTGKKKGAVKAEDFHEFLSDIELPTNEKTYLVMDNVRIHHASWACRKLGLSSIKELLVSKNIEPFYLPAYAPMLNSTEFCFNFIRHYIEKSKPETLEELDQAINRTIDMLDEKDMTKFFRHCYFKRPSYD
ncbi:24633_t:CDS:2 [Racocetra persica]|uniref:24633_t:CDS:1 n=1 Tax=Racocetra persica TaxID=160502 RepID=A0ACA9LGY2_9GLOM|nr:24633_t:CDS:2 [Racocetra persica]